MSGHTPGPYRAEAGAVYFHSTQIATPTPWPRGPNQDINAERIAEGLNRGEHFHGLVEALEQIDKLSLEEGGHASHQMGRIAAHAALLARGEGETK